MANILTVTIANREYVVDLSDHETRVNGVSVAIHDIRSDARCGVFFKHNDKPLRAIFDQGPRESFVLFNGREYPVTVTTERDRLIKQFESTGGSRHHHAEIRASMPGLVVRIETEIGGTVAKGQPVLILEAMKMENEVRAPADGIVKEIRVQQGRPVEKGDVLIVLD